MNEDLFAIGAEAPEGEIGMNSVVKSRKSMRVAAAVAEEDGTAIGAEAPEGKTGMNSVVKPTARRRKSMRVATAVAGITLAAGAAAGIAATPAYAGTNGQEIRVCGLQVSGYLYVDGPNQNGTSVHWSHHASTTCLTTNGYYWKGRVNLYATSKSGLMGVSKYCTVPKSYPTNVYACGNM